MSLGTNISRLRAEKRLSQGDLAEVLEVSRQSVSKWETDSSVPDLDKLIKLSQLFGVTLDELVTGAEPQLKVETASGHGVCVNAGSEDRRDHPLLHGLSGVSDPHGAGGDPHRPDPGRSVSGVRDHLLSRPKAAGAVVRLGSVLSGLHLLLLWHPHQLESFLFHVLLGGSRNPRLYLCSVDPIADDTGSADWDCPLLLHILLSSHQAEWSDSGRAMD